MHMWINKLKKIIEKKGLSPFSFPYKKTVGSYSMHICAWIYKNSEFLH
jgi:hypothetical protein